MFRKPLYSILFVILYLQTAIAGNWLTNNAASEVTFGEVSDVTRTAGSQKPDLHFDYDAMGQRISKTATTGT